MGKQGKSKAKAPPPPKKKTRLYQGMLAIAVVGVISLVFFLGGRESSTGSSASSAPTDFASSSLRNRLVLPAWPQTPRPVTLPPEAFSEPEVRLAYQAAKEIPDVLERIACYCGCYGSAGHRNNLDCYKDNHGVT